VADEAVDPAFGTGFVKVTPAHDATDFEIGLRHKLEMPLVLTEDGRMEHPTRVPKTLAGLDRFDARTRIVDLLKEQGLLEKIEPHRHAVRHCYRCDTVVEPRLSDQWFVKMKPLAEPALAAYHRGEYRIVPERWQATYERWMEGIRDWNISRQLWWGHRIPVFTCAKCDEQWADREDPKHCRKCGGPVEQDPDVLDTWFSSWLWPFATLGWPDKTPDLGRFYPGHTLVSGPDIIFFWVARMIMAGYHFMGTLPFRTVYLHGIVRDTQHRKMSKSLGNGIDPLDVVRRFGADALRWTVVGSGSLGADVILDPNDLEATFAPGRNFANKLWNIGRFILAQLPERVQPIEDLDVARLPLADRWIVSRAQGAIGDATASLEQFRLDEAAKRCFDFVWKELADWYVEAVKPRLAGAASPAVDAAAAHAVLAYCFDVALRLLHPVVPFITEELWQKLPGRAAGAQLATAAWPETHPAWADPRAELEFAHAQSAIAATRNIRAEYGIPPKTRTPLVLKPRTEEARRAFERETQTITVMSGSLSLKVGAPEPAMAGAHAVLPDGSEVFVPLADAIDVQQECRRLSGELTRLERQLVALSGKLANQQFVARAPAEVVAKEREKERAWRDQRQALADKLRSLGCS
jgi:valyl-tRNA synthetase